MRIISVDLSIICGSLVFFDLWTFILVSLVRNTLILRVVIRWFFGRSLSAVHAFQSYEAVTREMVEIPCILVRSPIFQRFHLVKHS